MVGVQADLLRVKSLGPIDVGSAGGLYQEGPIGPLEYRARTPAAGGADLAFDLEMEIVPGEVVVRRERADALLVVVHRDLADSRVCRITFRPVELPSRRDGVNRGQGRADIRTLRADIPTRLVVGDDEI